MSTSVLTSPPFAVAIALLLLNDWIFKPVIGNWVTGKLSDFAGVFAFSLFWAAMLPRHRNAVFVLTAAGFALWKSPLSDAPLAAWNGLGIWPLARVIDHTDWAAIAVLLPAHWTARRYGGRTSISASLRRRIAGVGVAGLSLIAFTATSVAPPSYAVRDPTAYRVAAPPTKVRAGLADIGLYVIDKTRSIAADTLLLYIRQPPERLLGVSVELREADSAATVIRMVRVSATIGPEPRTESLHRAFLEQVIEPLREWVAQSRQ
jgi:hypothetical protein